jgi:hypothetical protein
MSHETSNLCDSAAQANSNRCRSSTPRVWIRAITAAIVVLPASLLLAYGFLYLSNRAFNQDLPQVSVSVGPDGVLVGPDMTPDEWVSYSGPSGTDTSDGMGVFHSDLPGTGDLPAFLYWTIGLSITLFFLTAGLTRTTHGQSKIIKSVSWLSLGPLVGFAWTVFVAIALGPWMGSFSFPVLYCWMGGATVAALATLTIRPAVKDV